MEFIYTFPQSGEVLAIYRECKLGYSRLQVKVPYLVFLNFKLLVVV